MDKRNEYRIVRDQFAGFEVQFRRPVRRLFGGDGWSAWKQCGQEGGTGCNTRRTIEAAETFALEHAVWSKDGRVVKVMGRLP